MTSFVAPLGHGAVPPNASAQPLWRLLRIVLRAFDLAAVRRRDHDEQPPAWFHYPPI